MHKESLDEFELRILTLDVFESVAYFTSMPRLIVSTKRVE